jgi:hypothetical protein
MNTNTTPSAPDDPDPADPLADLDMAARAYTDASRPQDPVGLSLLYAALAGLGIIALAQLPGQRPGHLLMLALGVVLLALAHILPTYARRRAGLSGYQGRTRSDNTVFLVVAIVLVICAIPATSVTALIYLGLGVVAGVTYFLVLRRNRLVRR